MASVDRILACHTLFAAERGLRQGDESYATDDYSL